MYLPKPKVNETLEDYIARAMKNPFAVSEYPDENERRVKLQEMYDAPEREPATNMHVNFLKGEQVRVNVSCNVDNNQIRYENRDGRDVVIVPSATLPDNIVMNGILYPAEEIAKSYKTLEGTPAPLGHPTVNNMFVPALSPLGLNLGFFGAWNANVTRLNGRVYVEKIIDVERANESAMGRRVLAALEKKEPIHTSTGLLMNIRECASSDLAEWEGYDMEFDHDAILLDEQGAATPAQGVGMLVNNKRLRVVNSTIDEDLAREVEWMAESLAMSLERAEDRRDNAPMIQRIKSALMKALGLEQETETQENGDSDMSDVKKEDFDALSAKVEELAKVDVAAIVQDAVKPLVEAQNAEREAREAAEQAAKAELVNKVVEAELLDEESAKATPDVALKALLAKNEAKRNPAPGIHAAFNGKKTDFSLATTDWENS